MPEHLELSVFVSHRGSQPCSALPCGKDQSSLGIPPYPPSTDKAAKAEEAQRDLYRGTDTQASRQAGRHREGGDREGVCVSANT